MFKLRLFYRAALTMVVSGALLFTDTGRRAVAQLSSQQSWTNLEGASPLKVSYPAAIFNVSAGATERGIGRKFRSEDSRYDFSAYSLPNTDNDTPNSYLAKNLIVSPESLSYRRVTNRYFVMSSIRNERIFYSRCNFAIGIHCIFLEYPQAEKLAWDRIVTRISNTLRPR